MNKEYSEKMTNEYEHKEFILQTNHFHLTIKCLTEEAEKWFNKFMTEELEKQKLKDV